MKRATVATRKLSEFGGLTFASVPQIAIDMG